MTKRSKISVIVPLLFTIACAENEEFLMCDNEELVDPQGILYSKDVAPIIQSNCALADCHTSGFENGDFTVFEDVRKHAESGKLLFMLESGEMPPSYSEGPTTISDCDLIVLKQWLKEPIINN